MKASEPRISFDSTEEPKETTRPLKIDKSKSKFAKKIMEKEAFDEKVKNFHEKSQNRQQLAFELGKKFLAVINDTTLKQNKGPISSELEREVISDLINFAISINTDENEQEGMGSVSLLTLLYKALIIFRDNYNELSFKVDRLEKELRLSSGNSEQATDASVDASGVGEQ